MKEIYKLIHNFKIDKKFWNHDNLSGEDHTIRRSKPTPYIKITVKIAKLLGLKTVIEIGSIRLALSNQCVDYYKNGTDSFLSPPCCCDGHCSFFFADAGFETYTVDIDESCITQIEWSYNNIQKKIPENYKLIIPKDGIEFLTEFDDKIDVLILDCWDKGSPNYAEKNLEAFISAEDKLSDIHLVLIDDTDFITDDGGKDSLLSPYLIDKGYIPLFNGRQTLFINKTDVVTNIDNLIDEELEIIEEDDFIDDMNFELTETPKIILSMSTVPVRLTETREGWGLKPVIKRLISLNYPNYEVHLNIPYINNKTNEEYIIPEWIETLSKESKILKIFRCDDYGSITKITPTLLRIDDPEQIIITVDDDINYLDGFIEYHLKKRTKYPDFAIGFAGIGALDGSCHFCTTVKKDIKVRVLEGYKTASYKRGFFKEDFFDEFIDKSWSDDLIISSYLGKHNIPKIVINYHKDRVFNAVVESFPIINAVPNEKSGCNLFRSENIGDNNEYFHSNGYLKN
jgi:hypothetical protein